MIDMHSHVLPGVDDGAKNTEESLTMLSESYRQGVKICAATPHCVLHKQSDLEKFLNKRNTAFSRLKEAMAESGREYPEIILGGEVYLDNDLNNYSGLEQVCYSGTDYLLLEFPIEKMNPKWSEWIYELNRKGIKILLAHVDRYPQWEKMIADFKDLDVKYQVNAARFMGFSNRKLLKNLMEYGCDYVISSDMHGVKYRACNMEEAYKKARKKFPGKADKLFYENAADILKY